MRGDRQLTRRAALRGTGLAVLAATAGTAAGQETSEVRPDWGGWLDGVDGGYRDARGQDEVTVQVGASGNGGAFAFLPAGLWVDPGTTVKFEWTGEGGAHNVVAEEGPASLDSGNPVAEPGVHYEYTFEKTGITTYYCAPHRSLDMKGAVAVGDDVPTVAAATGGDGGGAWTPPGGSFGLVSVLLVFGGGLLAALSVLGADTYTDLRQRRAAAPDRSTESPAREPEREIEHDEYDPYGTAALIAAYFVILVLMWVFMYFVEFLGNGPTVIG